jgi:hypothetical protein
VTIHIREAGEDSCGVGRGQLSNRGSIDLVGLDDAVEIQSGSRMPRVVVASLMASLVLTGASAAAQTIRIAPATEVAREADPRRFTEPHLAIHPTDPSHLLAAVFIGWVQGSVAESFERQRCATFVSRDGGATWRRHDFALVHCADPQVAILPDGKAVFIALAELSGVQPRGLWLVAFHSADGGATWDEPTIVGRGHDHPALAVDLTSATRKGWIYLTTHHQWRDGRGEPASGVFVARSRNGGRSFDTPSIVSPNNLHTFAEMPAVLSDGTVAASFVDDVNSGPRMERRRAWIIRSTDGATAFSAPLFVNDVCGPPPGFQLSALAVDTSDGPFRDRLYFACRQAGGGPVVVAASADRGDTWNRPGVAVGWSPAGKEAQRVMTMGVNGKGVLATMLVERRMRSGEGCLHVEFSASLDGGATFTAPQVVSTSSCGTSPTDEIAARMFPTYGDYFGLVTMPDGTFRLMWPEMRGGRSVLLTAIVDVDGRAAVSAK